MLPDILRCADRSLYVGKTDSLDERVRLRSCGAILRLSADDALLRCHVRSLTTIVQRQ